MKKIIISIFVLFVFPLISSATSVNETCFNHGGTNCIIGSDWDGSIICNDGWRDSFVFYSSSSECRDMECTASELNDLYSEHDIREKLERIDEIATEIYSTQADLIEEIESLRNCSDCSSSYVEGKKAQAREEANDKIYGLELERDMLQTTINLYLPDINRRCKTLGQDRWIRLSQEAYEREQAYKRQQKEEEEKRYEEEFNSNACDLIGNAIYKNGECVCKEGYLYYKDINACKTPRQDCLDRYENVYWNDEEGKCKCKEGYYFEEAINNCFIKTEIQKENNKEQKQENNNNRCNDNQTLFNNRCIEIPENAHVIDSPTEAWSCNEGYEEINNSCVLVENKIEKIEDNIPLIENNNDNNDLIVGENVQEEVEIEPITPPKENKIKSFFKNIFNTIFSWFK